MCGHVFIFLKYIPRSEIAGHMVTLCLAFWGTARLLPKKLHQFIFPPTMYEGSIFPTLVIVSDFDYSHPRGCEVVFVIM